MSAVNYTTCITNMQAKLSQTDICDIIRLFATYKENINENKNNTIMSYSHAALCMHGKAKRSR